MNKKIVILATECDATNILVNNLRKKYALAGIIYERPISKKLLLKNRVKKLGWFQVLGQLLFILIIPKLLKEGSKKRINQILSEAKLDRSPIDKKEITQVISANSDQCIALLQTICPDIIILSGTRVISEKVLKSVNSIFINIHAGITPLYRGVHGAYWALAEHKPSLCGVTLHYVNEGIDTGAVIAQALIYPDKKDNFATYPYLQIAKGVHLLQEKLPQLIKDHVLPVEPLTAKSSLRYHPSLYAYLKTRFIKKVR